MPSFIRFCELQKASGNNFREKNATRYCALALLITGCAQQTFTVQNKPAAVTARKPSPIISSFQGGQKKTVDAAKICGGAENIIKAETSKHILVNGLLGFITLGIYTRWKARVYSQ